MKHFNLAIASIVDANTGNGLNSDYIDQFDLNYAAHKRNAAEIRSRSFLELIARIKSSVLKYIERSKAEAENRRATKELFQLDDRFLKDIGLTRDDLYDLRLGSTSLEVLNARRGRSDDRAELSQVSIKIDSSVSGIESANQAQYEFRKCA